MVLTVVCASESKFWKNISRIPLRVRGCCLREDDVTRLIHVRTAIVVGKGVYQQF